MVSTTEPKGARTRARKPRENLRTWAFDSAGNRKYAVQIQKAANGNPCLRIVEGTLETARAYMREHDIRTPKGHKWVPRARNGRGAS